MRHRLITSAAAILVGIVGSLVVASPASASTTCYTTTTLKDATINFFNITVPSAGSTASSTTCYMAQGANSNAVKRLQTTLNRCYGQSLVVDGDFGSRTKAALKVAQGWNWLLTADGEYGPKTRDGIKWDFGSQMPDGRWDCEWVDGPGGL
jgi:peptidoglycan hydrolase-like protein with peptidoglycan-binding domain